MGRRQNAGIIARGGIHPISFSDVQAKRKNHAKRHDPESVRKHAAQIFCEMLGQVCHKMFYENDDTEYQEVSDPPRDCV